ncbi:alpha/beta fold hydrolase [Paralcaligenes ginsengisoli]
MPASLAMRFLFTVFIALGALNCNAEPKKTVSGQKAPVKEIANQHLVVTTQDGTGILPLYASRKIDVAAPDIKRVLIIVHGTLRNAGTYFASGQETVQDAGKKGAGTMVVAPQFLALQDVRAFKLPPDTLAWSSGGWKGGEPARVPVPISSFSALDALLGHFADRTLYPALTQLVVVGHSAGAQVVQRYAVAGQGEAIPRKAGIDVRYVVANPSSYLYFSNDRPAPQGSFQPADIASCPKAIEWKYGLKDAPPYVAKQNEAGLEARYAMREVAYLLGTADTNPYTHFIDRSCAGMAQGPYRLARGLAYFSYMQHRHPAHLKQSLVEVPGVGHDARRMFTSACGQAVLFGGSIPASCPRKP